jgi:hypothetical protein
VSFVFFILFSSRYNNIESGNNNGAAGITDLFKHEKLKYSTTLSVRRNIHARLCNSASQTHRFAWEAPFNTALALEASHTAAITMLGVKTLPTTRPSSR